MFQKLSNFYTIIYGVLIIILRIGFRYLNSLISDKNRSETKVNISMTQDILNIMIFVMAVLTILMERKVELTVFVILQLIVFIALLKLFDLSEESVMNYNRKRRIKPFKDEIKMLTIVIQIATIALLLIGYFFIVSLTIEKLFEGF